MQGHLEIQCRNKAREERVKLQKADQKETQNRKAVENKHEDGFQTVNRSKFSRNNMTQPMKQTREEQQTLLQDVQEKEHTRVRNQIQNKESHRGNKNLQIDDQTSHNNNINRNKGISIQEPNPQQTIILPEKRGTVKDTNFVIDPGEVHNNYLKLISGTSLEEEYLSGEDTPVNREYPSDSSFEEEETSEDFDCVEESSSKDSEEYASVVNSEDLSHEDPIIGHDGETSDAQAESLVATFVLKLW
ncbi:hypothetical protein RND71_012403 [Anisodus tanguticus]|uniref:Uncharacterized protein n=1 Tax=Anisodus tanguticus TaxID=243964 RepID=A0AAE1SF69_9SOLA|nr:hypothetical protein RND71_012403 [Anisodus tanguticus]